MGQLLFYAFKSAEAYGNRTRLALMGTTVDLKSKRGTSPPIASVLIILIKLYYTNAYYSSSKSFQNSKTFMFRLNFVCQMIFLYDKI